MNFRFAHQATVELLEGDVRAIGAAVTVALCGHWEHDGPCRWPHLTTTESTEDRIAVHVSYDCADNERADVEWQIPKSQQPRNYLRCNGRRKTWSENERLNVLSHRLRAYHPS